MKLIEIFQSIHATFDNYKSMIQPKADRSTATMVNVPSPVRSGIVDVQQNWRTYGAYNTPMNINLAFLLGTNHDNALDTIKEIYGEAISAVEDAFDTQAQEKHGIKHFFTEDGYRVNIQYEYASSICSVQVTWFEI